MTWQVEARQLVKAYQSDFRSMMRFQGITKLQIQFGGTPDIASIPTENVVIIGEKWVTAKVMRREANGSKVRERKKRFIHELLHLKGQEHDASIGYSTDPAKDTYSWEVFRQWEQS